MNRVSIMIAVVCALGVLGGTARGGESLSLERGDIFLIDGTLTLKLPTEKFLRQKWENYKEAAASFNTVFKTQETFKAFQPNNSEEEEARSSAIAKGEIVVLQTYVGLLKAQHELEYHHTLFLLGRILEGKQLIIEHSE